MKTLHAPWRSNYATEVHNKKQQADGCTFCDIAAANNDQELLILRRFDHTFLMLNKYPYNAGHLLIIPYEHGAQLHTLNKKVRIEIMEITAACTHILQAVLRAHGINVGLNLEKAAGAGIPEHLHMHVLPRFIGDTNFMPTLMNTKTISFDLHTIYTQLKDACNAINID